MEKSSPERNNTDMTPEDMKVYEAHLKADSPETIQDEAQAWDMAYAAKPHMDEAILAEEVAGFAHDHPKAYESISRGIKAEDEVTFQEGRSEDTRRNAEEAANAVEAAYEEAEKAATPSEPENE